MIEQSVLYPPLYPALCPVGGATDGAMEVALRALGEIVCHPRLSDESVEAAVAQAERQLLTDPVRTVEFADRLAEVNLYANHPYMFRGQGSFYGLRNVRPTAVRWAYQTYVGPGTSVLAMVGRCTPEGVLPIARAVFGEWARRPIPPRGVWEQPLLRQSLSVLREEPVRSTCVMMAFPVSGITHEDFVTLRVIESLLAGGTGARLFRTVREQRHLAYEVSVRFPAQVACSHFALYALTNADSMEDARAAMAEELTRLQTEPVADTELKRAKAYLKGRYLLAHQYSAQYAFDLAWYELQDLGVRYDSAYPEAVERVTADDVQRAAQTYFTRYLLAVVMPLSLSPELLREDRLTAPSDGVQQK
ncbi:MAG: Peptidase M16 inactive domain protein [bacterium ADurb.Bin429]|nr:MAG: Peptidase M16 inactive domain protein [bacterium ADurb.Bin429]